MSDNSSYVTIQSEVNVSWKLLDRCDSDSLSESFKRRSGSIGLCSQLEYNRGKLAPSMRRIDNDYPEISAWLESLQQTMETMAAQLSELQKDYVGSESTRLSISAIGIELNTAQPCNEGDRVELILELLPSRLRIMVIGLITKIHSDIPVPEDQSTATSDDRRISLDFEHIRESDQEMLVRHIHKVQLEELRSARNRLQTE